MRFGKYRSKPSAAGFIWSLCLFAAVLVIFIFSINRFSSGNTEREKELLSDSLHSAITYCYASEGRYPQSLDYIKSEYGLHYDESKFYISYTVTASNIYPDVTIIDIEDH